jgi:glutathione S-transferase
MTALVLHTERLSPYGWTAALVAAEKGVPYRLAPIVSGSPEHLRLHPFGKMPVLQHGEIVIYETLAIAHYIDRAFEGPALQPTEALAQARVLQWISVVNGYAFPVMNQLIKARLASLWRGEPPDENLLDGLREALVHQLRLIDQTLAAHPFLVGESLTLADAFLFPQLHYASTTPEGQAGLAEAPATQAWLDRLRARPSFAVTNPSAG